MEPVLTRYVREPNCFTLDFYLQHEGYEGLKKALALAPDQVVEIAGVRYSHVVDPRTIHCHGRSSSPRSTVRS